MTTRITPKRAPTVNGVVEQFLHDFRARVGRDVVILRRDAEHAVAHASAGEVGDKPTLAQAADYRQCLIFLFDTHGPAFVSTAFIGIRPRAYRGLMPCPMAFNLTSREVRGHGVRGGVSDERRRWTQGVAPAVDADERGEDRNHGGAGEQAERSVELQSAGDAKEKRDGG